MSEQQVLWTFVLLKLGQYLVERFLAAQNRQTYLNQERQAEAKKLLHLSEEDFHKTLLYTEEKYHFSKWATLFQTSIFLIFIVNGGLGWIDAWAQQHEASGLWFFAALGFGSFLLQLPFDYYRTFVIEQRHGFNRQTPRGFFLDRVKGIGIGVVLGGGLLYLLLQIMEVAGSSWWVYGWVAVSGFSLLTAWLYPTFLAPMFNKFTPLEDGPLKDQVDELAQKVDFKTDGLFIMDASKRSSHGNAYFTGVFGKKRIVLFDSLVEGMEVREIIAVLAHELGHFKLHHVRWGLIRSVLTTGFVFYLMGLCSDLTIFYEAFGMTKTHYGLLLVFSLWFGVVSFLLQPLENYLSRRNEFAADAFAKDQTGGAKDLADALLKLREQNHAMPITHRAYAVFYHSHPPMLERLRGLGHV